MSVHFLCIFFAMGPAIFQKNCPLDENKDFVSDFLFVDDFFTWHRRKQTHFSVADKLLVRCAFYLREIDAVGLR